jgi:hypothetical protein
MVELNQICGPGGATARVPHGASDEVIEEALTWVLKNRISQALQSNSPDHEYAARALAANIMRHARSCGQLGKVKEFPGAISLMGSPSAEECQAFEEAIKNCRLLSFGERRDHNAALQLTKRVTGQIWAYIESALGKTSDRALSGTWGDPHV